MPFRNIEVSLFLSSPFLIFDEDPEKWWYTTIVYKAVTETLHAVSTIWGVALPIISISNSRWRSWRMTIYNYRIKSCHWNTSHRFDILRCRFSCHVHFKKSRKILTIDDIQQSYIKLLLKHFIPFRQIEVSLFLSSLFQTLDEDLDNWWYTTIVKKLSLKHFTSFWHIEVSLFLSSAFQKINENPDKRWYTTIVYKAVTEILHGLLTKWGVAFPVFSISNIRWRSWQMMIYNNRI